MVQASRGFSLLAVSPLRQNLYFYPVVLLHHSFCFPHLTPPTPERPRISMVFHHQYCGRPVGIMLQANLHSTIMGYECRIFSLCHPFQRDVCLPSQWPAPLFA